MDPHRRSWINLICSATIFLFVLHIRRKQIAHRAHASADIDASQGAIAAAPSNLPAPISLTETGDSDVVPPSTPVVVQDGMLHPQCYKENPTDYENRPVIIFKYSRTGSTWLAWTGKMLELESKKPMLWNWEAQTCNRKGFTPDGLTKYLTELFSREQNGEYVSAENKAEDFMKGRCLQTVLPEYEDDGGPLIATINPHETHDKTPPLTQEHWKSLFEAVPNLAVGVLVRTNCVKRAISFIQGERQKQECGSHKLTGGEDCIKDLSKQIELNITQLEKSIADAELKRVLIPDFAAKLSKQYGDGKMFCLTYEAMEIDIASEMEDFGNFIGAKVDEKSLEKIRHESSSYKRGSNDLSDYVKNYDEVKKILAAKGQCILDQLEATQPLRVFPPCGLYNKTSYNTAMELD